MIEFARSCRWSRGNSLFKQGLLESIRAANTKYEEAASLARTIGNGREEGFARKRIGDIHQSLSEFREARTAYEEALAAAHEHETAAVKALFIAKSLASTQPRRECESVLNCLQAKR